MDRARIGLYQTRMSRNRPETVFAENLYYLPDPSWQRSFATVLRAGKVCADASYRIERPSYPGQDILYCTAGKGSVRIGAEVFRIEPGQLAWIACEGPHAHWADAVDPWTLLWFRLDGPDLPNCRARLLGERAPVLTIHSGAALVAWFDRLFALLQHRRSHLDLRLHALVAEFFALIGPAREGLPDADYPPALQRTLDGLRAQPNVDWTSADLERAGGKSAAHLRRMFRTHLQTSPRQWLARERIMLGQRLLLETDHSVSEVAERCGFCDIYHFSRAFKKRTGSCPTAWRKGERGERP